MQTQSDIANSHLNKDKATSKVAEYRITACIDDKKYSKVCLATH